MIRFQPGAAPVPKKKTLNRTALMKEIPAYAAYVVAFIVSLQLRRQTNVH